MPDDGNIIFRIYDAVIEDLAEQRVAGIAPDRMRRNMRRYWKTFLPQLEPLRPYYMIPMPDEPYSERARLDANIAALELLADPVSDLDDTTAFNTLVRYTGFGGLSIDKNRDRFPSGLEPDPEALAHEYYTSFRLAKEVAKLLCPFLRELVDPTGRIKALEPSAGVGRFINAFNRACTGASILWDAVELSPIAAEILSRLHPEADVFRGPYERFNELRTATKAGPRSTPGPWNLVAANPPFGSAMKTRRYAQEDTDPEYNERYDYPYFLRRGLDSLSFRGIGAYILPTGFMDSADHTALRKKVLLRHHLMGAYRIPSHVPKADGGKGRALFPGQMTATDLVVFRSRGGRLGAVDPADDFIVAGEYFKQHPAHVLGDEDHSFRYAIVGNFDGFPELVERPMCLECTPDSPRHTRPRYGSVARRMEDEDLGEVPWLVRAGALGQRVDRFLALVAQRDVRAQQDARLRWRELHDALVAYVAAHGNPYEDEELASRRASSESIASLFRAFETDGTLTRPLQTPPKVERAFPGDVNDVEAQARWRHGELQRLTVDELQQFHASLGGTIARDELVERLLATQRWFIDDEELIPREEYLSGDLWPKFERVRNRSEDPQAALQERLLLEAISPRMYEDIAPVTPLDSWIDINVISAWMSEELNRGRGPLQLFRRDGLVEIPLSSQYTEEAQWCVGWLNHIVHDFKPSDVEDPVAFYKYGVPDSIKKDIEERQKKAEEKLSVDIQRVLYAAKWKTQFSAWVERESSRKNAVAHSYNRAFRGQVTPEYDASPLRIQRWTKDPGYQLKAHQVRATKARAATRGGILGFEVGVGKTFTALAVIALGREEGWIKRPVVLVPPRLAYQWVAEISKVLPDYSVVVIGRERSVITRGDRKGQYKEDTETSEERVTKWTEFQAGLWDIAIVTETAFSRLKINEEPLTKYVEKRTAIMREIIIEQRKAKRKKKKTERESALLEMGAEAWVKDTIAVSGDLDPGIAFDDIGIDFLTVDEIGLYRRSFTPMNREYGVPKYMGSPGKGSIRAWQADLRSAIIRQRTGGRGVLVLTGTLGENSPIEVFNVFHIIDPTIFEKIGLTDPETWLDRYLDIQLKRVVEPTGKTNIAPAVVGFQNLKELREILFRWGSFMSARRAGLKLPESSECFARVSMTAEQRDRYAVHRKAAREALKRRKTGAAFAAMNRMRSVALHPEIEDGYSWETATGGRATKEVSPKAVPFRIARGWSLKVKVLEEEIEASGDPDERRKLTTQLANL